MEEKMSTIVRCWANGRSDDRAQSGAETRHSTALASFKKNLYDALIARGFRAEASRSPWQTPPSHRCGAMKPSNNALSGRGHRAAFLRGRRSMRPLNSSLAVAIINAVVICVAVLMRRPPGRPKTALSLPRRCTGLPNYARCYAWNIVRLACPNDQRRLTTNTLVVLP